MTLVDGFWMREDGGMTSAAHVDLLPGAEPFSADGGRIGVLLSHGFTGSPASMTPWGRQLAGLGHTVRVPRLPGHGTTWKDMNTTRWTDWYAEVDHALTELHDRCDHVVVAGLSMGGCLALRLAEQRPDDVAAVVLVNPAINPRPWHTGQVRSMVKKPCAARTLPWPLQCRQVDMPVPGLAPEPSQVVQPTSVGTSISTVRPRKASSSVISRL